MKNEEDSERKCKALTQCLLFYTATRPLCDVNDQEADNLGQGIFLECARFVLDVWFQNSEDDVASKQSFKEAVSETFTKLQHFLIGQLFLVLQWLIGNGWNHPILTAMMTGSEVDDQSALAYLAVGELPEVMKLRIDILLGQQCEDLALNLCNWCLRSPAFCADPSVRKTQLTLLYKAGSERFTASCLEVQCCVLTEVLASLETDPDCESALQAVCNTTLLHTWLHPPPGSHGCEQRLLSTWLRLERAQHEDSQGFLNSVNKILQLAVSDSQRRLLLSVIVDLFQEEYVQFSAETAMTTLKNDRFLLDASKINCKIGFQEEYVQFCAETAMTTLKKDRFLLDASKIKREEAEADMATSGIIDTCRLLVRLFHHHPQMYIAALMTEFYLAPSDALFRRVKAHLQSTPAAPVEARAPATFHSDLYNEIYCVVDMLRPAHFHPSKGWHQLKLILVLHMLESGFTYDERTNTFHLTYRPSCSTPELPTAPDVPPCDKLSAGAQSAARSHPLSPSTYRAPCSIPELHIATDGHMLDPNQQLDWPSQPVPELDPTAQSGGLLESSTLHGVRSDSYLQPVVPSEQPIQSNHQLESSALPYPQSAPSAQSALHSHLPPQLVSLSEFSIKPTPPSDPSAKSPPQSYPPVPEADNSSQSIPQSNSLTQRTPRSGSPTSPDSEADVRGVSSEDASQSASIAKCSARSVAHVNPAPESGSLTQTEPQADSCDARPAPTPKASSVTSGAQPSSCSSALNTQTHPKNKRSQSSPKKTTGECKPHSDNAHEVSYISDTTSKQSESLENPENITKAKKYEHHSSRQTSRDNRKSKPDSVEAHHNEKRDHRHEKRNRRKEGGSNPKVASDDKAKQSVAKPSSSQNSEPAKTDQNNSSSIMNTTEKDRSRERRSSLRRKSSDESKHRDAKHRHSRHKHSSDRDTSHKRHTHEASHHGNKRRESTRDEASVIYNESKDTNTHALKQKSHESSDSNSRCPTKVSKKSETRCESENQHEKLACVEGKCNLSNCEELNCNINKERSRSFSSKEDCDKSKTECVLTPLERRDSMQAMSSPGPHPQSTSYHGDDQRKQEHVDTSRHHKFTSQNIFENVLSAPLYETMASDKAASQTQSLCSTTELSEDETITREVRGHPRQSQAMNTFLRTSPPKKALHTQTKMCEADSDSSKAKQEEDRLLTDLSETITLSQPPSEKDVILISSDESEPLESLSKANLMEDFVENIDDNIGRDLRRNRRRLRSSSYERSHTRQRRIRNLSEIAHQSSLVESYIDKQKLSGDIATQLMQRCSVVVRRLAVQETSQYHVTRDVTGKPQRRVPTRSRSRGLSTSLSPPIDLSSQTPRAVRRSHRDSLSSNDGGAQQSNISRRLSVDLYDLRKSRMKPDVVDLEQKRKLIVLVKKLTASEIATYNSSSTAIKDSAAESRETKDGTATGGDSNNQAKGKKKRLSGDAEKLDHKSVTKVDDGGDSKYMHKNSAPGAVVDSQGGGSGIRASGVSGSGVAASITEANIHGINRPELHIKNEMNNETNKTKRSGEEIARNENAYGDAAAHMSTVEEKGVLRSVKERFSAALDPCASATAGQSNPATVQSGKRSMEKLNVASLEKLQDTVTNLPEAKRHQIVDTLDAFLGKLLQQIKTQCAEAIGQLFGSVQQQLYQVLGLLGEEDEHKAHMTKIRKVLAVSSLLQQSPPTHHQTLPDEAAMGSLGRRVGSEARCVDAGLGRDEDRQKCGSSSGGSEVKFRDLAMDKGDRSDDCAERGGSDDKSVNECMDQGEWSGNFAGRRPSVDVRAIDNTKGGGKENGERGDASDKGERPGGGTNSGERQGGGANSGERPGGGANIGERQGGGALRLEDIMRLNSASAQSSGLALKLQIYFEKMATFRELSCAHCGREYASLILRRRHEQFFCTSNSADVSAEKSVSELLAGGERRGRRELRRLERRFERTWARRMRPPPPRTARRCVRCRARLPDLKTRRRHRKSCPARRSQKCPEEKATRKQRKKEVESSSESERSKSESERQKPAGTERGDKQGKRELVGGRRLACDHCDQSFTSAPLMKAHQDLCGARKHRQRAFQELRMKRARLLQKKRPEFRRIAPLDDDSDSCEPVTKGNHEQHMPQHGGKSAHSAADQLEIKQTAADHLDDKQTAADHLDNKQTAADHLDNKQTAVDHLEIKQTAEDHLDSKQTAEDQLDNEQTAADQTEKEQIVAASSVVTENISRKESESTKEQTMVSRKRKRSHKRASNDNSMQEESVSSGHHRARKRSHDKACDGTSSYAKDEKVKDSEDMQPDLSDKKEVMKKKEHEEDHRCSVCETLFSTKAELQKHAFAHLRKKMRDKTEKKACMDLADREALLFRQRFKGITIPKLTDTKRSKCDMDRQVGHTVHQGHESTEQVLDSGQTTQQVRDQNKKGHNQTERVRDQSQKVRDRKQKVRNKMKQVRKRTKRTKQVHDHTQQVRETDHLMSEQYEQVCNPTEQMQRQNKAEQVHDQSEQLKTGAKVARGKNECGALGASVWKETAFSAHDIGVSSIPLPSDTPDASISLSGTIITPVKKSNVNNNESQPKSKLEKLSEPSTKMDTTYKPNNMTGKCVGQADHPKSKSNFRQAQNIRTFTDSSHTNFEAPQSQIHGGTYKNKQSPKWANPYYNCGYSKNANSSWTMHKEWLRTQYEDLTFFGEGANDFHRDFFNQPQKHRSTEKPGGAANQRPYNSFREMIYRGRQKSPSKAAYRLYEGDWGQPNPPPPLLSLNLQGFINKKRSEWGGSSSGFARNDLGSECASNEGFNNSRENKSQSGTNEEFPEFVRAKHIDWRRPEPFVGTTQDHGDAAKGRVPWRPPQPVSERPAASVYAFMKTSSPGHQRVSKSRSVDKRVLINVTGPSVGPSPVGRDASKQVEQSQGIAQSPHAKELNQQNQDAAPFLNTEVTGAVGFVQSSDQTMATYKAGFNPSNNSDSSTMADQRHLYNRQHAVHNQTMGMTCEQGYYPYNIPHAAGAPTVSRQHQYQPSTEQGHPQVSLDYNHVSESPAMPGPSSFTGPAQSPNMGSYSKPASDIMRLQLGPEVTGNDNEAGHCESASLIPSTTSTVHQMPTTGSDRQDGADQPSVLNRIIAQYPNVVQQSSDPTHVAATRLSLEQTIPQCSSPRISGKNQERDVSSHEVTPAAKGSTHVPGNSEECCQNTMTGMHNISNVLQKFPPSPTDVVLNKPAHTQSAGAQVMSDPQSPLRILKISDRQTSPKCMGTSPNVVLQRRDPSLSSALKNAENTQSPARVAIQDQSVPARVLGRSNQRAVSDITVKHSNTPVQQSPGPSKPVLARSEHVQSANETTPISESIAHASDSSEKRCEYVVNADQIPSNIVNLLKSGGALARAAPVVPSSGGVQKLSCYLCKAEFSAKPDLEAHMSSHVNDVQQYLDHKH